VLALMNRRAAISRLVWLAVRKAFRKLDITSRVQLGARLG
jgi:hypothetical protein